MVASRMRFLAAPTGIAKTLTGLLMAAKEVRWAVAWATTSASPFGALKEHRNKIRQLTVGTHFYQTDPEFIEEFLDHQNVRFVLKPDGVFHPKLYFFEQQDRWDAVVGSPNFTGAALTNNVEIAVHISSDDLCANETKAEILKVLDQYRGLSSSVNEATLEAYRAMWKRHQSKLRALSGVYGAKKSKKDPKPPIDVPFLRAQWPEYFNAAKSDHLFTTEARLNVLEESQRLFRNYPFFKDIPLEDRKRIGGFARTEDVDWMLFGSMKGAGYFKEAVGKINDPLITDALSHIPISGPVTQKDYDGFVANFSSVLSKTSLATGTRLLTMKRPDYFVCLDSKNMKALCNAFEISKNIDLTNYWEQLVARVLDSNWWDADEPEQKLERRVWRCRVAFLDVMFYEPSGVPLSP